jgi:hypothetical protein
MTTSLFPAFKKRVTDAVERVLKRQVFPWSLFNSGHPFRIKTHEGKEIAYEGVGFEGSPRQVFWGRYIEPFLGELCVAEISAAVAMAKERNVDGRLLLQELQTLLSAGFHRVYEHMADIDRRLRGKGFPNSVEQAPVERPLKSMNEFLESHIRAELEMWRPTSPLEGWYGRNRFLVWAIPIAASIVVAIVTFMQ